MDARTRTWAKEQLQKKAAVDPDFRALLLRDPRAAIKVEFHRELPPEFDVKVMEETATSLYLVLAPPAPNRNSVVSLREVTEENVRAVCALEVTPEQKNFVASNAVSIAEAHFSPKAWFRAIYADDTAVGFVMLLDDPEKPRYYLWRYMVAAEYQKFGFGLRALQQVIDYVRTRPNATEMYLSYVPGEGSPRAFYARLGFEETGVQHGGENEMKLVLSG